MKATTLENKVISIRFNEATGKVNGNDYVKLNSENFDIFANGDGFTDFKVKDRIIRKYYPTWLKAGYAAVQI